MVSIACDNGVTHKVIRRILTNAGVEIRDRSHMRRKYALDELFFDVIDTEEKAYILGLLYADGCNHTQTNLVKLTLQARDVDVLNKVNRAMGSSRPLQVCKLSEKSSSFQDAYSLNIVNKHLSERLVECGVIPRKSLVLTYPEWIPVELERHFIRGYFDGDGHLHPSYIDHRYLANVVSTKAFCESLQKRLALVGISSAIRNAANDGPFTRVLVIARKRDVHSFIEYMYDKSNIYLNRKYNIYKKMCECVK